MRAEGMRHDTDAIVQSRDYLWSIAEHAQTPKEVRDSLRVVLDTLRDLSQQVVNLSKPQGLDREMVGKILDRLLR